ncbi:MAG TPA: hypothetical protein VMV69_02485 [Pirellulales bacterium]|nr:hypothetical protein [Pirellulales bacterium]
MRTAALFSVVMAASSFGPIVDARAAQAARPQAVAARAARSEMTNSGRNSSQWRYRRHNGHWWYWLASHRWAWWTGSEWKVYDKAGYGQWWRQTRLASEATRNGAQVAVRRSLDGGLRSSSERGRRRYEEFRQRAGGLPSGRSASPRFEMGLPGGSRGAGIGYGPYGGPVGRNQPGAIGNFGGANMGSPFGN